LSFDELKDPRFKKILTEGKTILYEKTDSNPRTYLAQRVIYKQDKRDIINELYAAGESSRDAAIVEHPVELLNLPLTVSEVVEIKTYSEEEMHIQVTAAQSRLLVIGNVYDTHWHVFIDNKQAQPYRTNYLFMGVVVPEGTHTVVFKYN
jgi:hypothetical protein